MVTPRGFQVYAIMAGVLLLGIVIGGGATFAYMRPQAAIAVAPDSPRVRRERVAALARELDLTDAQRAKIEGILEASRDERSKRMRAMYETCGEPVREHKRRIDAEIRAALTPEQQVRFDALADEQGKKFFPRREGKPGEGKPGEGKPGEGKPGDGAEDHRQQHQDEP